LDPTTLGDLYLVGAAVGGQLVQASVGAAAAAISENSPGSLGVPVFPFPASFAQFGLPAAGAFGVVNPTLVVVDPTLVFQGNLGVR
jgi:hypothetical protein